MIEAVVVGAVVAFGSFWVALIVTVLIRRLLHHPPAAIYRWSALIFALLIGLYAFLTSLGRG